MKYLFICPVSERVSGQAYIDQIGLHFDPQIWRNGVADPAIFDLEQGVGYSSDGLYPVTHIGLHGHFTAEESQGLLDNIPGSASYDCSAWTQDAALADMGLQVITVDEPTVPHLFQMYPYHKIWDMVDAPIDVGICAQSPKWNGHTCTIKYSGGSFVQGIEQGDNIEGCDRTERLEHIVPASIDRTGDIMVEGEVIGVVSKDPADVAYQTVHGTQKGFDAVGPKFLAFNVQGTAFTTWTEAMAWLDAQGFDTVLNYTDDDYPKDGEIYRIDNRADEAAAPIGLFALKYY